MNIANAFNILEEVYPEAYDEVISSTDIIQFALKRITINTDVQQSDDYCLIDLLKPIIQQLKFPEAQRKLP